jgi:hypothetical protein
VAGDVDRVHRRPLDSVCALVGVALHPDAGRVSFARRIALFFTRTYNRVPRSVLAAARPAPGAVATPHQRASNLLTVQIDATRCFTEGMWYKYVKFCRAF